MLSYLAILGAALSGLAGIAPWAIAATAIALASLSYAEHQRHYERARDLGLTRLLDWVLLRSLANGLLAGGLAYAGGWLLARLG